MTVWPRSLGAQAALKLRESRTWRSSWRSGVPVDVDVKAGTSDAEAGELAGSTWQHEREGAAWPWQWREGLTKNRVAFVLSLVLLGSISIAIFTAFASSSVQAQARAVFEGEARIVTNSVKLALTEAVDAADIIKIYMDTAQDDSRETFQAFATRLLESTHTESFEYIPEVRGEEARRTLEDESELYWGERLNRTDFPIRDLVMQLNPTTGKFERVLVEAEKADVYFPIKYVEPAVGNEQEINLNALSVPGLDERIMHSINTGETVSIGPRFVATDAEGAYSSSIIMQVPLDTKNAVVLNTIRVPDMMSRVLAELPEGRELYIFGSDDTKSESHSTEMLFGGFAGAPLKPVPAATVDELRERQLFFQRDFQELGRSWTVVACSNADYATVRDTAVVTPAALLGVLFVGMIALSILVMRRESQHSRKKTQIVAAQARKAANAVTRAERNLNDFLAHEVRNPLSVAIAAQRFLLMSLQEATWTDGDASAGAMRDLDLIGSSLTFILELMSNMLDLNKCLAQQGVVLNPTTVSLKDDVLGPVKSMLGRDISGISIQMEVDDDDIWVLADGLRLKQVVMNLAKNAIKFVETGFVRLSAHRVSPERVIIAVEDSGPGVPEHQRETMFSKYQESLDKMQQGTGIGLCLSKLIVDSMHGNIYLDTDYNSGILGCPGARFVVDVPLEEVEPPEQTSGSLPEPDVNALATRCFVDKAILVVDDDAVVRAILVRRLKHLFSGVSIKMASSGEAAFALLAELGMDSFAVIFMDHYMPGPGSPMTGVEAIQRLRAEGFDGLVFGCSANDVRRQHLKAGADEFFLKPLPADAVVSRAIQRCSALREVRSVLIVDDQKVNLLVLRRLLRGILLNSATITSDTSGEAALTRDDHFDVVILDEHMGTGLLGSQVAARMRARGSQSLIISLSGGGLGEAVLSDKHTSGFDALWEKPLPPADVLSDQLLELLLVKDAAKQHSATPPVSPMDGAVESSANASAPPPEPPAQASLALI